MIVKILSLNHLPFHSHTSYRYTTQSSSLPEPFIVLWGYTKPSNNHWLHTLRSKILRNLSHLSFYVQHSNTYKIIPRDLNVPLVRNLAIHKLTDHLNPLYPPKTSHLSSIPVSGINGWDLTYQWYSNKPKPFNHSKKYWGMSPVIVLAKRLIILIIKLLWLLIIKWCSYSQNQ